jgi:LysM repeat protein
MELPTRNGKTMMQQFPFTDKTVFLILFLIFSPFGGCAYFQKSEEVEVEIPQEKKMDNYDVLVRESRDEADRLRSELATIKIAAAKNNGNFRPTQGVKSALRHQEEELNSEMEKLKADNLKLQEERDLLRHQNVQLQARSEALPGMRQLVMDIKALQTSVHQLVTKMETLSSDITQVKQDIALQEQNLQVTPPKLTARPAIKTPESVPERAPISDSSPDRNIIPDSVPEPIIASESAPERTIITVEWGDTLWDIARTHDLSVEELKKMNGLTSDSIFEDQQLEVPLPRSRPAKPNPPAALAAQKGEKPSNEVTDNEGTPNATEGP